MLSEWIQISGVQLPTLVYFLCLDCLINYLIIRLYLVSNFYYYYEPFWTANQV